MYRDFTYMMHLIVDRMDFILDGVLQHHYGVPYKQFEFLAYIHEMGTAEPRQLAHNLGLNPPELEGYLEVLERDGWITVTAPGGKRTVVLTGKALEFLGKADERIEEMTSELMQLSRISEDEVRGMSTTLERLQDWLLEHANDPSTAE